MNLYLHGIDADPCPITSGVDSLASDPGERFSVVLTNPPFGKKSSIAIVNEAGDLEKEDTAYERQDFWTTTKNKQLNFLQHVKTLLKINGRCAIVVPDNVLFEGGAGETVRRNLLKQCDVHTLLRLPTGIFYAQGVKANVLFFDAKPAQEKPWTTKLWVYDLRTNMHFTQKTNPLKRSDLDEFVECYQPGEPAPPQADLERADPRGPLAGVRLRGAAEAGQGEPRHFLAQGQEPGGLRRLARTRRAGPGDRRRLADGAGAVCGDCGEAEEIAVRKCHHTGTAEGVVRVGPRSMWKETGRGLIPDGPPARAVSLLATGIRTRTPLGRPVNDFRHVFPVIGFPVVRSGLSYG